MINLKPQTTNNFIIYYDTINSIDIIGNYFLMRLTNGFSKQDYYVVPNIIRRNTKFIELQINLVPSAGADDPINGDILIEWDGNFDYKIWNTIQPTLNPAGGAIIDEGQAFLEPDPTPEITWDFFQSKINNNIVYLTRNNFVNQSYSLTIYVNEAGYTGSFYLGLKNQMTNEINWCRPTIINQNERFLRFEFNMFSSATQSISPTSSNILITPNGTYDYFINKGSTQSNQIYSGQLYFKINDEITYKGYTSSYDNGGGTVYYTSNRIWNKVVNLWELCDWNWNE